MKRLVIGFTVLTIVISITTGGLFAPKDAVAKVGKQYITERDVQARLELEAPDNKEAQANTQNRQVVLNQLINETLLVEAAKKEGYGKTDTYKQQLSLAKDQLLINQLAQDKILPQIQVTAQDVQAFYQANIDKFGPFESRRLSHIQTGTQTEATSVLKKLRKGSNFAKLAQENSEHPSAQNGGDIGAYQKGDLPKEFSEIEKAAFKMRRKGDFSGVIKSPLGFHIVQVTDIVKRPQLTLNDVQQDIYTALVSEKRRQVTNEYLNQVQETIPVKRLGTQ